MNSDTFILPFFYKRFMLSTQAWSDEEVGAYMRLLIHQWDNGSLPNDIKRLKRISESVETHWLLLKEKFKETPEGLKNSVMEQIRIERLQFHEKQRLNGSKGGRKRNPTLNPEVKPKKSESSGSISSSNSIDREEDEVRIEDENIIVPPKFPFDPFWDLYDKKTGRAKCEARWDKISDMEKEVIMQRLPAYIQATSAEPQFRKDPYTWLNGKNWLDEYIPKKEKKSQFDIAKESLT